MKIINKHSISILLIIATLIAFLPVAMVSASTSDFVVNDGVLTKYRGKADNVTIPSNVTVIGNQAFENCKSLVYVKIPEGVTEIQDNAFLGCKCY